LRLRKPCANTRDSGGVAVHEDGLRAESGGGAERHGGVDAELARGVGRGRDDAALIGLSTDDHGLAFERRVEEFFDGDEEGVHVDVEVGLHGGGFEITRSKLPDAKQEARSPASHRTGARSFRPFSPATRRAAGEISVA
jgi:hypothetical protein